MAVIAFASIHAMSAAIEPVAYESQLEARSGENFSFAAAQCWLPPGGEKIKGILCIVLHPHERDGMLLREPAPWHELASKAHCALMAISIVEGRDLTKLWFIGDKGAGRVLLAICDDFARKTGRPELGKVPIVAAGVCAAGQFAYEFAAFAPQRVKAFVTIGGSLHNPALAGKAAATPGLLVTCADRGPEAVDNLMKVFAEGRRHHAPWALSIENIADYDKATSSDLVIGFLRGALEGTEDAATPESPANSATIGESFNRWMKRSNVSNAISTLQASELCIFPNREVRRLWSKEPERTPFSFCGQAIQLPVTLASKVSDLGKIKRDETGHAFVKVNVDTASTLTTVSGVEVIEGPGLKAVTSKIDSGRWRSQCTLDLSALPSGSFNVGVPIRLISEGKLVLGRAEAVFAGKLIGDVIPDVPAISLGSMNSGKIYKSLVTLRSSSGASLKAISVSSTLPSWIEMGFAKKSGMEIEVDLVARPPQTRSMEAVSGYLDVDMKGVYAEKVRIFAFGFVK